ncbi:hypothetical protein PSN01_02508 [Micromonospora saelicesensis]|nr:hypothetical protein PSN01_02508 [Micromonospora saelicesensis]
MPGGRGGTSTGVDGPDRGGVGEPGGGVHRVADDRVLDGGLDARDDVAGVQSDPQPERRATAPLVVEHPADGPLHGQGGPDGTFGVVLVRHRGAEDRHDAVTGQLVDVPAERLHRTGEGGEDPVGDRADAFRVEVLRPGGELGEVTEEHGDHPALGRRQRGGSRQRGATVVAEPRAGNGNGSTHGAGHMCSNPLTPGADSPVSTPRYSSWARTDHSAAHQSERSTSA